MIVKNCMVVLILSVTLISVVKGASYSNVYVGSEVIPREYIRYGTPYQSIVNPALSQINARPPPLSSPVPAYVAPCGAPCVYPAQTVANVNPSANVLTYTPQIPSVPIVVTPTKEEAAGYEYSYVVYDENTGDHKAQRELSDGSVVRGEYSFIQPDGYVREVQYVADDISGFNAVVKNFLPVAVESKRKFEVKEMKESSPPCHEVKNESFKEELESGSEESSERHEFNIHEKQHKKESKKHSKEESGSNESKQSEEESKEKHHGKSKKESKEESGEEEDSREKHHKKSKVGSKEESGEESEGKSKEKHHNKSKEESKEESGEGSEEDSNEKHHKKSKKGSKEESGEESEEESKEKHHNKSKKESKEESGEESEEESKEKHHNKYKKRSKEESKEESEEESKEKHHKIPKKGSKEDSEEESKEESKEKHHKKSKKGSKESNESGEESNEESEYEESKEESREKHKNKSRKGSKESGEESVEKFIEKVTHGKRRGSHEFLRAENEVRVPYNDIVRCIQAAISRANGAPSAMREEPSPLTYIILNKPC